MPGGAIGTFRSGKGGRQIVGSTQLKGKKWSTKESNSKQDTTNFESFTTAYGSSGSGGGRAFTQGLIGNETAKSTYSGNWDAAVNAFDNPPAIYMRDDGPQIKNILNRVDNNFYLFYATLITDVGIDVDQAGMVAFDYSFENQGAYVRPTGSFSP